MDDFEDQDQNVPENQQGQEERREEQELEEAEQKLNQGAQQGIKTGRKIAKAVRKGKKVAKPGEAGTPTEGVGAEGAGELGAEGLGELGAEGGAELGAEGVAAAGGEGIAAAGAEGVGVGAVGAAGEVAGGAAGGAAAGGAGAIGVGGGIILLIVIVILIIFMIAYIMLTGAGGSQKTTCSGGIFADSTTTSISDPVTIEVDGCPEHVTYSWSEDSSTQLGGTFDPQNDSPTIYTPPEVSSQTSVTINVSVCSSAVTNPDCSKYSVTLTVTPTTCTSIPNASCIPQSLVPDCENNGGSVVYGTPDCGGPCCVQQSVCNGNPALYWAQRISDDVLDNAVGCSIVVPDRTWDHPQLTSNGWTSAKERGACDQSCVGSYCCTRLAYDAYRLAGITSYPVSTSTKTQMTHLPSANFTTVKANDVHNVKPGDAAYWKTAQSTSSEDAQHTDIVKSITVDTRGNGTMYTLDANISTSPYWYAHGVNPKVIKQTIKNWQVVFPGSLEGIGGVWFGEYKQTCNTPVPTPTPTPAPTTTAQNFVALGDSLTEWPNRTASQGPISYSGSIDGVGTPWPSHLDAEDTNLTLVYNAGVAGNTTQQMINRFSTDVTNHNPGVLFVLGGTNDIFASPPIADATVISHLQTIINDARNVGISKIILLEVPPQCVTSTSDTTNTQISALNTQISNLGNSNSLTVVDIYTPLTVSAPTYKGGVNCNHSYYQSDGLHFTDAGAQTVADTIYSAISPLGL